MNKVFSATLKHPVHLEPEKDLEGKYVIQTEERDLSPVQAVETTQH